MEKGLVFGGVSPAFQSGVGFGARKGPVRIMDKHIGVKHGEYKYNRTQSFGERLRYRSLGNPMRSATGSSANIQMAVLSPRVNVATMPAITSQRR